MGERPTGPLTWTEEQVDNVEKWLNKVAPDGYYQISGGQFHRVPKGPSKPMTQDQYYALFPNVEEAKAHEAFILGSQVPFPPGVGYYDFLAAEYVRISRDLTEALRVGPNRDFGTVGHDGQRREAIRQLTGPVRFFSPVDGQPVGHARIEALRDANLKLRTEPVTKPFAVAFDMDVEARRLEFDCGEHITTCVAILIAKAMRFDQAWSTTFNTVEITATPTSNLQKLVAGYRRAVATRSPKAEEHDDV